MTGIVCICSRGLIHSRTVESVLQNLPTVGWCWEFTHDLPIPEAQNQVVKLALEHSPEWLWFVEEDMVIPPGTLAKMLDHGTPVVVSDYRFPWTNRETGEPARAVQYALDGTVLWAGLGCLLAHKSVLEKTEKPWFQCKNMHWSEKDQDWAIHGDTPRYGRQDVWFFKQLRNSGIPVGVISERCGHLRLTHWGEPRNNRGVHEVELL
ncbi:MAG: hypothetical protein ACRD1R_04470 [Acidobacteriota bacterium]